MPLHQFDYIFAIGTIFAALDAFMIGANDVANSFATSVSSRSLTLRQACLAAALCEFGGAVLVGARVSGTIKNNIINLSTFHDDAGLQMLAFTCALVASSSFLTLATRMAWPVSTTYSIVSAIAGVGVAVGGTDAVIWGWNGGKGLATIFAGLLIAPSIAACFGAAVYLITKFVILVRKDPVKTGLVFSPFYFFVVAAVLTMSIVYKGAPSLHLDKLSDGSTVAAIVGTAAVVSLLSLIFWMPYVRAKVVKKDYTIRWYHFFMGPLLWNREPPADAGTATAAAHVPDYRVVREEHVQPVHKDEETPAARPTESERGSVEEKVGSEFHPPAPVRHHSRLAEEIERKDLDPHPIEGAWIEPKNLYIIFRYKAGPFVWKLFTHGSSVDVHALQTGKSGSRDAERQNDMYARAKQYGNETEHMFSFLQVMTACTASFAHGSNDVSNAIGPFAAIYEAWSTAQPLGKNTPVPVWILAFGGAMIVIGLATYGYNIMAILGNRLTLHSPSRGFSMELGAAITVILASQYGIPVSTTMCITGSTLGVALCNGDIKAFNWRSLAWIISGWILTIPVVSTLAGCLIGIIINAPRLPTA
ncbi:putative Sodium:inorganic phosphate symporter [Exidia glandulosa HHB12029]|uniref:Phosphate transporter n=1 Tax=Exidia glandulosa HHB12029 TaxID=1314781 RepID=A0A165K353_EXIGL|nr:putative Sodium:inorganic phosphate symporter [Exidia glandulosa HHB12029]